MTPTDLFSQLNQFTKEAYEKFKIDYVGTGRNNYGPYALGEPSGHVMHYTASPDSPSRVANIMERFKINSGTKKVAGVGVSLVVFDSLQDKLADVRKNYPQLYGPNGVLGVDVLHWGFELAFYTSNWANKFTVGTELRNAGKIEEKNGQFYWGGQPWKGRTPIQVRGMYAEPFTDQQILDSVFLCKNIKLLQGQQFKMVNFMSHHLIHPNKWDSWPHYPFGRVKRAVCNDSRFVLDGYLDELNSLKCPKVTDEDTAETFLVTMGYLVRPVDPDNIAMKKYLTEDIPTAIRYFQLKKDLKPTGTLTTATISAMEATRRAYKL